jgi:hypothetical protein
MPVPGQWCHYEFQLTPATFGVSAETFEQVMQDVAFLGIRSEWISGAEVEGLDNYRLSKASEAYWAWISQYYTGSDLANEGLAGKLANPDGDGADNWGEYVANTVPTNRLDYLRIESVAVTNTAGQLDFNTHTGRLYSVQSTTALAPTNVWNAVINDIPGTGSAMTVPITVTNAQQFYRLTVRLNE